MESNKCPYCKKRFEKIPLRKKKCNFCGKYIYVRTKPKNREKVLIRKDEIEKIEKEWINYATNSYWFKKLEDMGSKKEDFIITYYKLKERFGSTPLIADVLWGAFNDALIDSMKESNQNKQDSIRILMDEFKEKESNGGDLF